MKPFKIALLGDSVLERWGPDCAELMLELRRLYSRSEFEIENHGLHLSRAGYGLWRIGRDYLQHGQTRPALSAGAPDVVIVESFAYTNYVDGPEGLAEYRDVLRRIAEEIEQTTTAKMVFHITLPPHRDRFGENTLNYHLTSKATRQRMADEVKLYLDEARNIAVDEGWPLADAATEVEKQVAQGGNLRRLVNQNDSIYPSRLGYSIAAKVLVRAMDDHRLIEEAVQR